MKIAIVQPTTVESALRNTEKALESGSQVVLLPEKWVKTLDDLPLAEFQRLAVKYTAFIVPGAVEDEVSVISPIITPRGQIAGIAKKIHLFGNEKGKLIPGTTLYYFTVNGVRIGIVICYDLDFPEVPRALFSKGVEVLLVPSKIRREGMDKWREYVRMRALENRIAVINANAVELPNFVGGSIAVVPYRRGEIVDVKAVAEMGEEDGFVTVDIDPMSYFHLRLDRLRELVQFSVEELSTG
ncbi:Nitrilase [Metallosphaera sp. J1]|uniref:carbon-nitrogen hydrolase family protein n=1 Tax=Metallosphaera TaxID=41980 RepID=UPI001EDF7FED|nr:carbon-nitrogen hydrolase family protein [Metallosphaera javensis (ex Hofmann et al. 2022)]MCG3109787.1 Nitrilase [Metallosphaera javensis (ex Hofmann et al. 2022)]BCS92676.1 MAG: nitrilase [Metallosphaera javensis (ex Sakai et al. 2022)]